MKAKRALLALLVAMAASAAQFGLAAHFGMAVFWQVIVMHYLAGKGPILGYANGQPIYEGTPVHMLAAYVGVVLGVVVYWLIGYVIVKTWHNYRMQRTSYSRR